MLTKLIADERLHCSHPFFKSSCFESEGNIIQFCAKTWDQISPKKSKCRFCGSVFLKYLLVFFLQVGHYPVQDFAVLSTLLPLSFFSGCVRSLRFAQCVVSFWQKECGWRSACVVTIAGRIWERNLIPPFACSCTRTGGPPLGSSRVSDPWCYRHRPWCIVSVIKETLICCLWRRCITADLRCHVLPFAFKSSHVLMYTNVVLQIRFSLSLTDFIYLLYNVAFFCDIFLCSPY